MRYCRVSQRLLLVMAIAISALAAGWYIFWYLTRKPCVVVDSPFVMKALIGMRIIAYGQEKGQMPDPNKWCDILVEDYHADMRSFKCPESDALDGESSYAMNKNLAGMKVEDIPNDVVVLFETDLGKNTYKCPRRTRVSYKEGKPGSAGKGYGDEKVWRYRWNQCGGPEILTTARHKRRGYFGCYVVYMNHERHNQLGVRWVYRDDVGKLKWKPERRE